MLLYICKFTAYIKPLSKGFVMTNNDVVKSWVRGYPASNGGSLSTDGKELFSYRLLIGTTDENGTKTVYNYTAETRNFKSQTTSRHVSIARSKADRVEVPSEDK